MIKTNNKTTGKAKRLIMAAALCILSITQAWAYDFSVVVSSGQTLYFNINSNSTSNEVYITYPNSNAQYTNECYSGYTKPTGNLIIPSSVTYNGITYSITSIGNHAFHNCTGLTSVNIPNSVTNIGYSPFYECSGLTSVTIPNSVTTIGNYAFYLVKIINYNGTATGSPWGALAVNGYIEGDFIYSDNTKTILEAYIGNSSNVIIPNSVTSIGEYAFYNCTGLTSVTIPNSVTTIGESAFESCTGLTSVTIPNSVTTIGNYAFYECTGLTSVTIPNSVTTIENSTFYNCSGLTSVTIPNSVDSIGVYAFYNCTSIGRIDLKSVTPPTINSNSFQNVSSAIPVYIPCGSLSNYSNSNWGTRFPNLQESQVFSLGVAVNDSTMGMALILSNTCANSAIQAYAYDGYNFVGWSDGSTNNPRVVTLTQDTVFTAIFEANVQRYTITVMSANNNMGTVSGGGTYEEGTQATITATPAENHHFVSWNDGNTDNPRTITVTGDATYIANFAEDVQVTTYTITVMSANNNMGSVMGGGTYEEGAQASFAAIPTDGHHFVSWNDGNTDNPRTITVTSDAVYIASFAEDVSIDPANELDALTFHPNPTSGTITFNCTDIRKVEVMDAMGRMVAIFENSNVIDLSKLGKGYYAMRITTDNGVAIRKVVRN